MKNREWMKSFLAAAAMIGTLPSATAAMTIASPGSITNRFQCSLTASQSARRIQDVLQVTVNVENSARGWAIIDRCGSTLEDCDVRYQVLTGDLVSVYRSSSVSPGAVDTSANTIELVDSDTSLLEADQTLLTYPEYSYALSEAFKRNAVVAVSIRNRYSGEVQFSWVSSATTQIGNVGGSGRWDGQCADDLIELTVTL